MNANSLYDSWQTGRFLSERLKAVAATRSAHRRAHGCFDGPAIAAGNEFLSQAFVNGIRYDFRTRPLVFTNETRDLNIKSFSR
ncbi:MAG: hypothetical protein ACR2FI_13350, partial [Burkholderiales bacterium]